ncbi:MAG: sulfatase-like hydrolase/transferase [Bacteroidetes bacterium]|nr:sulfatase-like hydrolase/transferase [Bacteroidota bacterium]
MRYILQLTLMMSVVLSGCGQRDTAGDQGESRRPNIVLIFTDDLDFDEIGTYTPSDYPTYTSARKGGDGSTMDWGYYPEQPATPNIDNIAKNGIKFTRFYVPITVCTPSRYALLTGQRCGRSEAIQEEVPLEQNAPIEFNSNLFPGEWNFPRALQSSGYKTGFIGKFHLIHGNTLSKRLPENSIPVSELRKVEEPVPEAVLNDLKVRYGIYTEYIRENYGFDYVDGLYIQNTNQTGIPDVWGRPEGNMEWMTYHALQFMEQNKAEPFFLLFAPNVPHGMFGKECLKNANRRATPAGLLDEHIGTQPSFENIEERIEAAGLDPSATMPMYLDDGIGVIINKLRELGLDENTLVIFTSDHQSRGKWYTYEAAHVPALAMWPGKIKPGRVSDQFCSSLDIAPTLLDVCGVTLPPVSNAKLDGQSFKSVLLSDEAKRSEEPFLIEMGYAKAIIYRNWKFIALRYEPTLKDEIFLKHGDRPDYRGKRGMNDVVLSRFPNVLDEDQLYDLDTDMFEQLNLAGDASYAEILEEMKQYMREAVADLPHDFSEFK